MLKTDTNLLISGFCDFIFFLVPVLQERVGLRRPGLAPEVAGVDPLLEQTRLEFLVSLVTGITQA